MIIWGRVGISVTFASIFCVVATETLQKTSYYETHRWHLCLGLLAAGAVLWLISLALNARAARRRVDAQGPQHPLNLDEDGGSSEPGLFFSLSYWGLLLVVFSIIIAFLSPQQSPSAIPVAARTNPDRKPAQTRPSGPETKKVAAFPPLKLQGLIHGQPRPSALIDGRTYFVGEHIGEVKLVSIEGGRAVLEFEGQTNVLVLDK